MRLWMKTIDHKMNEIILKAVFLLWMIATCADGYCQNTTLIATTSSQNAAYSAYKNNEDCTITIRPSIYYLHRYYLEIKWQRFEINDKMPHCSGDYMEVFLTRSIKSIGKYCSSNIGSEKLFNMYSDDGYAAFRFKSDGSGKSGGIAFSYQLKSYNGGHFGSHEEDACLYRDETHHGLAYTSGWPRGYKGPTTCIHTLTIPIDKYIRVVVMDLDLRKSYNLCNAYNDFFQIKESSRLYTSLSSILSDASALITKSCGTYHPTYFTGKKNYIYLLLNKPWGSYSTNSSHRGFMVGYLYYGISTSGGGGGGGGSSESSKSGSSTLASILGSVLGTIVVLAFLIYLFAVYMKKVSVGVRRTSRIILFFNRILASEPNDARAADERSPSRVHSSNNEEPARTKTQSATAYPQSQSYPVSHHQVRKDEKQPPPYTEGNQTAPMPMVSAPSASQPYPVSHPTTGVAPQQHPPMEMPRLPSNECQIDVALPYPSYYVPPPYAGGN